MKNPKTLQELNGCDVRVYWNLHKDIYSIQQKINGDWRVVAHAPSLQLVNVTFRVWQGTREKVAATGVKTVHAFVEGVVTDVVTGSERQLTYNPKKYTGFVDKATEELLGGVQSVSMATKRVSTPKGERDVPTIMYTGY